ncbi:MAG: hypothetical protein LBD20_03810 [Spirochaetaceae bacterium]|jgi:hypothetical protein|nr:hypothetical protein [Spirochaetaceae bacterium]
MIGSYSIRRLPVQVLIAAPVMPAVFNAGFRAGGCRGVFELFEPEPDAAWAETDYHSAFSRSSGERAHILRPSVVRLWSHRVRAKKGGTHEIRDIVNYYGTPE